MSPCGPGGPSVTCAAVQELIDRVRRFSRERDWERFHSPKNLAMALVVEAAEVVEVLQWLTEEESRALDEAKLERLRHEIGDVMILLTNLADHCGVDPIAAAKAKLELNEAKYPAERVRGKALKYDEYGDPK